MLQLARQQDYQGRFGPYTCVHLYINEEAIRASEDNSRHIYNQIVAYRQDHASEVSRAPAVNGLQFPQHHLYDEPPYERPHQQSLPQLHRINSELKHL